MVYSPILSSQIPPSFAANAFNVFQRGMHQFEIVRLCALWDGADAAKENIPTVVELIDDSAIIDILADETRQHWAGDHIPLLKSIGGCKAQRSRKRRARFRPSRAGALSALYLRADPTVGWLFHCFLAFSIRPSLSTTITSPSPSGCKLMSGTKQQSRPDPAPCIVRDHRVHHAAP